MRKNTVFAALMCFSVCAAIMFTTIMAPGVTYALAADTRVSGVTERLQRFGDAFAGRFKDDNTGSADNTGADFVTEQVLLGGYPIGLKLYADGVVVVGTEAVDTENGEVNSAEKAGIRVGDIIKNVNGKRITRNAEVSALIEHSGGEMLEMTVERGEKTFDVHFRSAFSVSENKYKAGMWIRDSSAGIGTVSFCTVNGGYASLGHAVCDIDTKEVIPISTGECTGVELTGFVKGTQGAAGELCGYLENGRTGSVLANDEIGVYGSFDEVPQGELFEIAAPAEIQKGYAQMYTTVENGETLAYDIEITEISNSEKVRNLTVRVTDENLINKTGGIIQGMSGSPIVQNGKIVGAVTHVFVNDPLGGYGIFASTMLGEIRRLS